MAGGGKKGKSKPIDREQQKLPENAPKKPNISDAFLDELTSAFTKFDKIPETKRIEQYGDQEYLEQFREYFKKEYPNLLDKIDKKDLPIYLETLEKRGYTIGRLRDDDESRKLNAAFKSKTTETHVMENSLEQLKHFSEKPINNLPADVFDRFASVAGFNPNTFKLADGSKLQTIDDLLSVRKKFLEKEGITIGETSAEEAEHILTPDYNPTERLMVSVALSKIRKTLSGTLRDAFDEEFPLPVTVFSAYQDLLGFKTKRTQFLLDHAAEIDKPLAKKLDGIIVTNGDIQQELYKTGRKFDSTKGFSEREQQYRRVFNKLVTRQLFEEVQETQATIDHYIDAMGSALKEFPPYVNEILKIYPFNDKHILAVDPTFHTDLHAIDTQITETEDQYAAASDEERKRLAQKIRELRQQREYRKWQAYIAFLRSKEPSLATIFDVLVAHKFDFSVLTPQQQQLLVDTLVKHKLQDTIKNKVPELLSVTEEDLTQFTNDLFDLSKMEIMLPTKDGPIPLKFTKKAFMSTTRSHVPSIDDLKTLENLPLNFTTDVSASNDKFFEENKIFDSLYYDFKAKNGTFRINDAYKVRLKKDGKIVEGYLSSYSPLDERNVQDDGGKELYLYSEPMTAPDQERTLISRPKTKSDDPNIPVVIKDNEQPSCDIEILDKQLNLNGQALGALLFGYVLGQQSMNQELPPEKEKELEQKLGKLKVYKEKNEDEPEVEPITEGKDTEKKVETSSYDKFLEAWGQLKGYNFPDTDKKYKDNKGFVEGSRLFMQFADSQTYPKYEGRAWLQMEIVGINKDKGTFKVKVRGGELGLGSVEGKTKELSLTPESLQDIKDTFGEIYKMPDVKGMSMQEVMPIVKVGGFVKDFDKSFSEIKREGNAFKFSADDAPVTHFGWYEPGPVGEQPDSESRKNYSLYKIKYNSNGTVSLSGEFKDGDILKKYSRDMDYPTFLTFIREKGLQPKTKEQADDMKKQQDIKNRETPTTNRPFSIGNFVSFFKNGFSKIKDAIKKYDDENAEDLTDILVNQGSLYSTIGKMLPFARISAGFESMGLDYFAERDSRIWKKVEKRKKVYEDADFSLIYEKHLKPMISGQVTIEPHYKAAAMLLAMINKGKGPYNRNPEFAAKGMRVNILMGPAHQKRYLDMRQKLIRELEQGTPQYGQIRADNKKNEILELEMKYIVHVMDARQLGVSDNDKTKYYFYGKYSKTFIDELEKSYTGFFSQSTVEEGFGKVKNASFDFARAEFFRLLESRPQQAIPFLKVMATKAVSQGQRKIFEMAVMAGMLSGIFLTMTMSETQGMIQKVCRTRGFIPGIWVRDIHQQSKLQRILDIFSGGSFSKEMKYSSSKLSFDDMSGGTKTVIGNFQKRMDKGANLDKLSEFFKITGKNVNGKTLLDIYADEKTKPEDKVLIEEFLKNSNEKNEGLDNDIRNNPYAMSGSILTKSQSVVDQMMKFDSRGFAGKDGDEIQTMEGFFDDMKKAIPTHTLTSSEQVKFYLDKFFNRFEERGFSGQNKTEFIKRLKYCQEHPDDPGTDTILYYAIVGQVCSSFHRFHLPKQFEDSLLAWKSFFKKNINTILDKDVMTATFGGLSYYYDYQKYTPKLESWEVASSLLDKYDSQLYINSFDTKEKKDAARKHKQFLKRNDGPYINGSLYELAEALERNNVIQNKFKQYSKTSSEEHSQTAESSRAQATGAKIKNPEIVENVRRILEDKPLTNENPDEYPVIPEDDDLPDGFYE